MNNNIQKCFEDIENKSNIIGNIWCDFYEAISKELPESYQLELSELSTNLKNAFENFKNDLHHPTLVLATTGTTSSGKSSLVNFLCGSEIVPVATSEMSAGVVTIEYQKQKSLFIYETPGATWECGEWHNISDKEIYQRLYKVMIDYIDNRKDNSKLGCPKSLIHYPFRIRENLKLGLPHGTQVKLLDLPGLAYVGDEGNAEIIRQCREALCLVTYNSAETDERKVENLLQEVIHQVKELGGSPARMLFILNRIDVFRSDRTWPESEQRFVEKTIKNIKSELINQLKEYTPDIENLNAIKLSTWPALLTLQVMSENIEESTIACKKADNHFNGLIEEVLEVLVVPRRHDKWSEHHRNQVAKVLWDKSYAPEFEQILREHITNYFPQLVIPQMIERFNVDAGNAVVEWSIQTTNAILNSSKEKYDQECDKIKKIRKSLEDFLKVSNDNLKQPFVKTEKLFKEVFSGKSTSDPVFFLEKSIKELQETESYNSLGERLYPIYGWNRDLGKGMNEVLEAIAKSLKNGIVNLDSIYFKKADSIQVNLLERNLSRLIELGYTSEIAINGKKKIAKTNEEKRNLKQMNDALNELALHLSMVMKDILTLIMNQAGDRIYEAVNELFKCHLSYLEEGSSTVAPMMAIKLSESKLIKIQERPKFSINFNAGFDITPGTWEEAIETKYKERIWWTLWIVEETKYKTEYKTRSSDNADIPKVGDLLKGWVSQGKDAREGKEGIYNQIISWILDQVKILINEVNKAQHEIIDRYEDRLNKAHQEIAFDYEKQREIWEPIHQLAVSLEKEFISMKID